MVYSFFINMVHIPTTIHSFKKIHNFFYANVFAFNDVNVSNSSDAMISGHAVQPHLSHTWMQD